MPAPVSFASFNLYNFQAAGKRMRRTAEVPEEHYKQQRDWAVGKMRDLNADVIAVQELWSKSCRAAAIMRGVAQLTAGSPVLTRFAATACRPQ